MPKGVGTHYRNVRAGYIFLIRQINISVKTEQPIDKYMLEDWFMIKFSLSEGILDKMLSKLEKRGYVETMDDEVYGKKEFITKGLVTDVDFDAIMDG